MVRPYEQEGDGIPPDKTDGFDDADLPGLEGDEPSPESDLPTEEARAREGDVFDRVDDALGKWESDLEVEGARQAARRAAEEKERQAFERTKRWLREWARSQKSKPKTQPPAPEPDPESVVGELAPYDAMGTLVDPRFERIPARWIYVGGFLGLVLVGSFFVFRGDSGDGVVAVPSETPIVETAAPNTEAVVGDTEAPAGAVDEPEAVVEDEPAVGSAVVPEAHTIEVEGEAVETMVWRAITATHVLVAAPSLNSTVADLAPVAATIAGQDCAAVVAFDSSLASPDAPIYRTIINDFDGFGFNSDAPFSTLGSSATAAGALVAADEFGAQDAYLFSPSDLPPFNWEDITPRVGAGVPHVVVRITTGDSQYRPLFDEWIAAGYEGYVVEGQNHGTAFFNEPAATPVLDELVDHICGHPEGFHD